MSDPIHDEQIGILTDAYDQYADAIFRHCFFHLFNREVAKDLTQEAFVRTWTYLQKGNTVENMRAFLYRIANNLIVDETRKRREASLELLAESGFQPAKDDRAQLTFRIDASLLKSTMKKIPAQYREVIVLRYVDELTPEEISKITGETANAVSVRLHRALATVRKVISQNYPDAKL